MGAIFFRKFIWLFAFCLFLACPACSAELPLHISFASRGDRLLARIQFDIPEGYHAYANQPGAAGKPTHLNFVLEDSGTMPAFYPPGQSEPDIYDPKTLTNVYYGPTSIIAVLPNHSSGKMYAAELELLLCSNRHCVPVSESVTGTIPEDIPQLSTVSWAREALDYLENQAHSSGALTLEEGIKPPPISETTLPEGEQKAGQLRERLSHQQQEDDNSRFGFSPYYFEAGPEIYSLWKALLFGIIAGLLLNAMPCVLPVLTLKVSGILLLGGTEDPHKLSSFRKHNICFALGVLSFFTFLALLLGIADMMWGQLYQHEAVLLLMLLLVFLMGLSMLGVFSLPMLDLRFHTNDSSPNLNAYFTGVLSTFLATPCSGPLLGGVLAWAFLQPLPVLMAVFWSVGMGMSLPYLAFSLWPRLAHFLPRPGAWMHLFEQCVGFLLLGTAIYLLSILPQEKYIQILSVLLLAAMGAWLLHTYCGLSAPTIRRRIGGASAAILLTLAIFWILSPTPPGLPWQSFTQESFAQNLGRKAMLVEFTADWCPNCKFLENTVLTQRFLRIWTQKYQISLIKVDITHDNPAGQKLLNELGSRSIPVTALFPVGPKAKEPVVLRDIYGQPSLEEAMKMAFAPSSPFFSPPDTLYETSKNE